MFAQGMIYFLLILAFGLGIWFWVIKPLLKGHGVEIDEPDEIQTGYTKSLDKTKAEFEEKKVNVDAVTEEASLTEEMADLDKEIKKAEKKIEKKSK